MALTDGPSFYESLEDFFTLEIINFQLCGYALWKNKHTGERVVTRKRNGSIKEEVSFLMEMMCRHLDKYHIVKFHGWFATSTKAGGKAGKILVFEKLDISLQEYLLITNKTPMVLSDIRVIIQQMATALEALKRIGVIHGNISLHSIVMVDHQKRPLRVKLTDFSLAMLRCRSRVNQAPPCQYRCPEMILGLPFSEAIDMWSLGCVMFHLICGHESDVTSDGDMRPVQDLGELLPRLPNGRRLRSLDGLKTMRLESDSEAEAEEREQCIELLKAMLEMNPDKRITPSEVLTHPFINCISNPFTREQSESSFTETSFYVLDFEMMGTLGEGGYGETRRCRNNHTGEVLAVKRPKEQDGCDNEIAMLTHLRCLGQSNIVRLCGWFNFSVGKAPAFEMLDMSLLDLFLESELEVMPLSQIRVIIQQMATALEALKMMGIIHADIKPDNIMLVDHRKSAWEVKLIDFGEALYRSDAEQGAEMQVIPLRAPELLFGLPFSEAIDMWSLGCVMASLISGTTLFSAQCCTDMVALLVQLLGQPADHDLDGGKWVKQFFTKTKSNHWTHKRPEQDLEKFLPCLLNGESIRSLDDLKTIHLESENKAEAEELEQCIKLLKAMLEMDAEKRITPSEVLRHPFINWVKYSTARSLSRLISVQPAPPEKRCCDVDLESPESLQTGLKTFEGVPECTTKASIREGSTPGDAKGRQTQKKKKKRNMFLRLFSRIKNILKLGVVSVHSTPENSPGRDVENPDGLQSHATMMTGRDIEINTCMKDECEPDAAQIVPDNINSDHCSPPPTTLTSERQTQKKKKKRNMFLRLFSRIKKTLKLGVVSIHSTPENSPGRDVENPDGLQSHATMMTGRHIEINTCMKDECEPDAAQIVPDNINSDHCSPPPTTLPSDGKERQTQKKKKKRNKFLRFF